MFGLIMLAVEVLGTGVVRDCAGGGRLVGGRPRLAWGRLPHLLPLGAMLINCFLQIFVFGYYFVTETCLIP